MPQAADAAAALTAGALVLTAAAAASTFEPPSNVRRTVPKHNSPRSLAVAQKADGLTICEEQILKVERDGVALPQNVERLTQLVDILCVESAADGQHRDRTVSRALYLEHRPGCVGATFGPMEKGELACALESLVCERSHQW